MAAIAFDPLEYAHELEASGVSRKQAEVHAKAMTATFLHNFDALVTRDYLSTRFTEFETRVEANMDRRFSEMESSIDKRFAEVDKRFVEIETKMDTRFVSVEARIDKLSDALELRFERIDSKISRIYLMFGLTMATATIPILQNFFGG
ncbi:MAG: hypothetical protein DRR42_28260 [Gammaproteobacteria bacterium]|nr:MAG: hypothetical protein DRR42_28260 [Gammaproteobacteria bacterium]